MAAVLVLLSRPETAAWLLSAGDCLGKLIGDVEIHALVVRSPPARPPMLSVEVPPQWKGVSASVDQEQQRCEALRHAFANWLSARPELAASTHWQEVEGLVDEVVLECGRDADSIVLEQARGEGDVPQRVAICRSLLESGRPVLVMPRRPCTVFGRRVSILWQDDRYATKALQAVASWLTHADEVDVIVCARQARPVATLPPILVERGIPARLHILPFATGSLVRTALAQVRALGSDMVIMGAYGHGALRSMILGSVTDQVIAQADRPLLLCH